MTRETRAQRETRLELERQEEEQRRKDGYLTETMLALERATALGFLVTVVKSQFNVVVKDSTDHYYDQTFQFGSTYSPENWDALDNLDWALRRKEEERATEEAKYEQKRRALAKLTKEDRQALGLE